ncbi:hypothetical protein [Dyadobacter chenhuakuii]|uniref:Restriction endonuclease n=1 Tax=Dyadobacter chenhuakuii TaxID=2909339 RepID=A0ABY4XRW2_9BACT|nr:hypothetical protein [Dyadobacter chenhuakuii]MCF2492849.1 hypothetical protein [Dyadobacter chenhuakuii]USJ32861.1 hypothetical protein NFI80_08935 [Dyadobacter chenhuakuii]
MTELLEIADKDIAALNDTELRSLIGLLCEAECRKNGISSKAIQWGGPQDAPDDGIDVLVTSDTKFPTGSYIPRSHVIFQSKVTDMTPALIRKEMKRSGELRESIFALAKTGGAYIIVSGHSVETKRYNPRITEMKKIIGELDIMVDYYHGGRIASWVRESPSIVLWVRQRAKRPVFGWKAYDDWTLNLGTGETYLLDEDCRLIDKRNCNSFEMTIESGISEMRNLLSQPGSYLRLTGLSGVGKTRLAQALFDENIGSEFLDKSIVIYTDISFEPTPSPQNLVEQLVASQDKVILIIDNCTPKLHTDVVNKLKSQPHSISLLTIEYDVRDDLPDETGVFHLEPSSDQLIQKLILRRFPNIGELDAWKIADVSGGNARVAIALANTVKPGESIGHLRNNELFDRLFNQRNPENDSLKSSAEILSLVYSYEIENIESESSELGILSLMSSIPAHTLFKHTAELKDRKLVQSRGKFRAVLPHAIANRLAIRGLALVTDSSINKYLLCKGNERMIRSFSRRLSYIPDNERAQDIVENLLAPEIGWMNDVSNLNEFQMSIFENLATIVPEHALAAIERAKALMPDKFASRDNRHFSRFVRLLRHIAYEEHLFVRGANVMTAIALTEKVGENTNPIRAELSAMYYIIGSGTHASVNVRMQVVKKLWDSKVAVEQQLATELIDAALEAWHFRSYPNPNFGSRLRDFGISPQNSDEYENWFIKVVQQCFQMLDDETPFRVIVQNILASKLRGMWTEGHLLDLVESICERMTRNGFWGQGWFAISFIIRYDLKDEEIAVQQRLLALEKSLKPKDLFEQIVAYFISDADGMGIADVVLDDDERGYEKILHRYEELGVELAKDINTLDRLLRSLFLVVNTDITQLAQGIYYGATDKETVWNKLLLCYLSLPVSERQTYMLKGWIRGASKNSEMYSDQILDQIVNIPELKHMLLPLQSEILISPNGLIYLQQALDDLEIHSEEFKTLRYSLINSNISPEDLTDLTRKISSRPNGREAAFEILYNKCHVVKSGSSNDMTDEMLSIGRQLLLGLDLEKELKSDDNYKVADVVQICFEGESAFNAASEFALRLMRLIRSGQRGSRWFGGVLRRLVKVQPICFLDTLLEKGIPNEYVEWIDFHRNFEKYDAYLSTLSEDLLLSWCNDDPLERYKLLGGAIVGYEGTEKSGQLKWKPIFWKLIEGAPILRELLDEVENTLNYQFRASAYAAHLTLFTAVFDYPNQELATWARLKFNQWNEKIVYVRRFEEQRYQNQNESFE